MLSTSKRRVALCTMAWATGLLVACGGEPQRAAARPTPVKIEPAQPLQAADTAAFAGVIVPRYESDLAFRVAGKIERRLVNAGDTVTAGTPLAVLDARDLALAERAAQAALAQARSQATLAADELARHRSLHERNLVARAELERRESAWRSAQAQAEGLEAQWQQARNAQQYGTLRADAAGVVTAVLAEAGQVVTAGQPVLRVAQTREIEAQVDLPERLVNQVRSGQSTTVSVDGANRQVAGRVREIASAADAATRTYRVRISLAQAGDLRLGMSARMALPAGTGAAAAPPGWSRVPIPAVVGADDKPFVYIVDAARKAQRREVTLQRIEGSGWVVVSGVQPGEAVVAAGAQMLKPGETLAPATALVKRRA